MSRIYGLNEVIESQYQNGIKEGNRQYEKKILQAAENGTPINIEGRAWFLKSDIQNLRDIFSDIEMEAKQEPIKCSFEVVKQLLFDCAANLMLTDKPREEVADDLLKAIAELDKYKIVEEIENGRQK